jgi:hypothetical protein
MEEVKRSHFLFDRAEIAERVFAAHAHSQEFEFISWGLEAFEDLALLSSSHDASKAVGLLDGSSEVKSSALRSISGNRCPHFMELLEHHSSKAQITEMSWGIHR